MKQNIIFIIIFLCVCIIVSLIIYFMTNKQTSVTQSSSQPITKSSSQPITQFTGQSTIINSLSTTTQNAIIYKSGASLSAGAYGLKLLYNGYFGPILKVRRSNDNSIADFYSDINGNFTLNISGNGTSLINWLNGADAYITKWYDQTGNRNHATQTEQNAQPKLNIVSKTINFMDNTFFNLPDGTHPFNNSEYSYIFKCSIGNSFGGIFGGGTMAYNQANAFRRADNGYNSYWFGNDLPSPTGYSDNSIITTKYSKTTNKRYIYKNGILLASNDSTNRIQTNNNNYIGKTGYTGHNEFMNGSLSYLYILPISISQDEQVILENT